MFELKRLWLQYDEVMHQKWKQLMERANLDIHDQIEYTLGIFDGEDLIATGSFDRNIIKCLVVCQNYQSEDLLSKMLTSLMQEIRQNGFNHFFIYTSPEKEAIFQSLGFQTIIKTADILFLEQGNPNLDSYLAMLRQKKIMGVTDAGAIVMNANPFTKGHQYLVEHACRICSHVYVFVLSDNQSEFSANDRMEMVKAGVAHLKNVTVLPTNDYMVSSATFPAYFLKDKAPLAQASVQARLDALLFKHKIAPILEIRSRFVGDEPFSKVTDVYNQAMQEVFQPEIQLHVLKRLAIDNQTISATKVRKALKEHDEQLLLHFLPQTTYNYLKQYYNNLEVNISGNQNEFSSRNR